MIRAHSLYRFARPRAPAWAPPLDLDTASAIAGSLALVLFASTVTHEGTAERERIGGASGTRSASTDTLEGDTLYSFYLGMPYTHASDVRFLKPGVTDLTLHGVNWDGRPFKSPIYYGLRARRWSEASTFGTMVDFTHSKTISQREQVVRLSGTRDGKPVPERTKVDDLMHHFEFSHGHNMLTLNGLFRLGRLTPVIRPYVGAGAGVALPHTEIQFKGEPHRTYEYQYAGPVGQALAGIEIRLPITTVYIEYKFTLARMAAPLTGRDNKRSWGYTDFFGHIADWWRGTAPEHGWAMTTLASHQVIAGSGYRHPHAPSAP